jgi:hypothetical protein
MPLRKGGGKKVRSANIATEIKAGRPRKQAIAIAYAVQRRGSKKKGTKRAH